VLIIHLDRLSVNQQEDLQGLDPRAVFWPRSWVQTYEYNFAVPTDWWIHFSQDRYADYWLLKYTEICYVARHGR
jgi:hypothetical protein